MAALHRALFAIMLLGSLGAFASCGSPASSLEICHKECDAEKRCGDLSDAQADNCNTNCDDTKGQLADTDEANDKMCKNAGSVRDQQDACLGKACNDIQNCETVIDTTCVEK